MRAIPLLVAATTIVALANSAPAAAQAGYAAAWKPGTGAQRWQSGMTVATFKARDAELFAQGFRLRSLSVNGGRYTAVWRPGTGTQLWASGMTLDEMRAKDETYFSQGLRIALIDIDGGRFAAVWQTGTGTQWWKSGMTVDQLKTRDTTYFNQGLRMRVLEIHNGLFTAVWRPGTGAQWWRAGMTGDQMDAQTSTYQGQGLRLALLAIENGRMAAVWQPGSGSQFWARGRCRVDFETQDALHFSQGLHLAFIERQAETAGMFRYPWTSGASYNTGQGNNNAGGSHTGSQAFAFDFSTPVGTIIRAARAGTVEWVKENQTTRFNPNQAEGPGNRPFANGSLDNWGNAVRIRHGNGLTSWYFHLAPNSVSVSENQQVERGQPIALAGLTGRTSGPHLHFQVQANSTNWGQSVGVTFGDDCQIPTGGDTATSNNAQ